MRAPGCALTLVLGFAALCCAAAPAAASMAAPSLAALTARAERIVVSEVVEVRCEREAGRDDDVPVTLVTLRVLRILKGGGGSQVVLDFLGGAVGADRLDVPDIPRFAVGDRDILFLSGTPRRVSPIVGVMRGRFRLVHPPGATGERVAAHDGRLLTAADLLEPGGEASQTALEAARRVSPAMFEGVVLALVAAQRLGSGGALDTALKPRATTDTDIAATDTDTDAEVKLRAATGNGLRLRLDVDLGPSPALADGCPDWSCALESKEWFRMLSAPGDAATGAAAATDKASGAETVPRVSLGWAHSVFGRVLDADTTALSMIEARSGATSASVAFNRQPDWNSYGVGAAPAAGPLDLPRVAARELALVASALVAPASARTGGVVPGFGDTASLARARRAALSREASLWESVDPTAGGCGPGDVFVDPRLLLFDSPDHALMTAYQVGFFEPGAASPAQVVDVPLSAFLTRRVVDLPNWAATAMQTSLVVDIRSAGLATPLGVVYTYRVRGVWAGGTTAWSDSSQPFVRCSAASSTAR